MQPRVTKALDKGALCRVGAFLDMPHLVWRRSRNAQGVGKGGALIVVGLPSWTWWQIGWKTVGIFHNSSPMYRAHWKADPHGLAHSSVRNLLRHRMVRSILSDLHAEMPRNLFSRREKSTDVFKESGGEQSTAIFASSNRTRGDRRRSKPKSLQTMPGLQLSIGGQGCSGRKGRTMLTSALW